MTRKAAAAALIALLASPLAVGASDAPDSVHGSDTPAARTPVVTTAHFAFFSDFETNLNDALITAGLARTKGKPELFGAGAEKECFDALAASRRAGWDAAVSYYSKAVSPADWKANEQYALRMELAGFDAEWREDEASRELVEIARGVRRAAAPAFQTCRWPAQDAQNRRWIAEIGARLAAHEDALAARLFSLYGTTWKVLPVLIDVVETAGWSGASTSWSDAGQGDVLISSTVGGAAGFETLFHESSHVLMGRGDPVRRALDEAASAAGVKLPGDLWHVVLFATTGEAVRQLLESNGEPGYVPMLTAIQARGDWTEYREAIDEQWLPYVRGERALADAASRLIAAIGRP